MARVPVGALLVADNLVVNRDGIADSRRGVAAVGTSLLLAAGQYIAQWFGYQNRLLQNDSTGRLFYDSTGALVWAQASGTFNPPAGASKIRGVEANKNFYLSTAAGVYKLAAYNSTPILSGVPGGLDGSAALAGAGSGFLGAAMQCAYQIVFGYTDANGNLLLGTPSERINIINAGGGSDNVVVTATIPQGLSTSYFYQLYRTPQTAYSATPSLNVPPGAEPQLAAQYNIQSTDITNGYVSVTDVTTDALLGTALYTNPSQQGALQPNTPPPLCVDFCFFSQGQMTMYANCFTLQTLTFSMISVGSPNGVQVNDTITINGIVFTGEASQNNAAQQFKVTTGGTVSANIDTTARALIACVNANAATTFVYAYYLSGYNNLPGMIELQASSFSQGVFAVTSSRGGAYSPQIPSSGTSFSSSNDYVPNGIFVSKSGQPEAAPANNLEFVGGGDQPIYRVLPLQDRVVVIKSDGIFVITGSSPSALTITLLDSTVICIAPESCRLLNNSVYAMTQQGVVSVTSSGVTIVSRAVEGALLSLTGSNYPNFSTICHAVSYESERLYILALPSSPADTYPTQEYCYNWVTNAWTRWTLDLSSGLVNPFDNRLYVGRPKTNPSFAYQERKSYGFTDYMDDAFNVTVTSVDATGLVVSIASVPLASWVGLALNQTNAGTATILAVNPAAQTITVSQNLSTQPPTAQIGAGSVGVVLNWLSGVAQVQTPIQLNYLQVPMTGNFPHITKNWGRADWWFYDSNAPFLTCAFVTDTGGPTTPQTIYTPALVGYGSGPYGSGPYGTPTTIPIAIQTLIPNANGARWVLPFLQSYFPGVKFACLGFSCGYEVVGDSTG